MGKLRSTQPQNIWPSDEMRKEIEGSVDEAEFIPKERRPAALSIMWLALLEEAWPAGNC